MKRPQNHLRRLGIEDAAALLAAIVASSSDAILSKTLDGTITSWNKATERLFGYTAQEMVGKSIRLIIPADRQAEEDAILARIAAGEQVDNYETIRQRKDGRLVDVSVTISPVRDRNGTIIGASKIIRDITEKKRAEEQIKTLMREVNHRAKNMLAVVQAMAKQTTASKPGEFLKPFLERLQALSANQDLLIESNWLGIDMSDLVHRQLAPFQGLVGTRISALGPRLTLTAAAAQSVGLALHELVTNASKYGALSNETGRIEIAWQQSGDEFDISWCETGGPPVETPKQQGFGSTIITKLVVAGIGGKAEIHYAASGVKWLLTAPASEILLKD